MPTTKRVQSERDELPTVRQVLAELGGVSRDTFYERRERRVAPPCFRLPNGHLRVRGGDLLDWLDAHPRRSVRRRHRAPALADP